jgi:hypothetical protein
MTDWPRPPAIDDLPAPGPVDVLRMVWWTQRGFLHVIRHGHGAGRAASLLLATCWCVAVPLLIAVQFALQARPRARYYLSPQRDAVLAVVTTHAGWHVEDHSCARPGTGAGRALRAQVLPQLLAAADADHVPILATAATRQLAARYAAEVPGLIDVGRGTIRGRRLRRPAGLNPTRTHPGPSRRGQAG